MSVDDTQGEVATDLVSVNRQCLLLQDEELAREEPVGKPLLLDADRACPHYLGVGEVFRATVGRATYACI